MTIDKALTEIFFRVCEGKEVFIKITATNRRTGNLVYTTYGSVKSVTRDRIYFSYKRMSQGKGPLCKDDSKDYECYIKPDFNYDITFIEDFGKSDFSKLIDLTLHETFTIPVYSAFKNFLNNNYK